MLTCVTLAEEERAGGHPVCCDWAGAAGAVLLASLQAHGMPSRSVSSALNNQLAPPMDRAEARCTCRCTATSSRPTS